MKFIYDAYVFLGYDAVEGGRQFLSTSLHGVTSPVDSNLYIHHCENLEPHEVCLSNGFFEIKVLTFCMPNEY
jgi:hypothetical protein